MNAPANLSINDQIRARDGDNCWLCAGKLDFAAVPNSKKAPTREHLLAQSLGGTNDLANLVLCHPGCNKQLGVRPVAQKMQLREKMQANTLKNQQAKQAQARAKPAAPQVAKSAPAAPPPAPVPGPARSGLASPRAAPIDANVLRQWQVAALVAGGLALLFFGFSVGLLVG